MVLTVLARHDLFPRLEECLSPHSYMLGVFAGTQKEYPGGQDVEFAPVHHRYEL
jgi:hypothetical protein